MNFKIDDKLIALAKEVEEEARDQYKAAEEIAEINQYKVISAMQQHQLSDRHFSGTTGYGYDDIGRDTLDKIYATVFNAEAALVRHQIVSGTQALSICLYGCLRPGDKMAAITGRPYDTLAEVIGIRGEGEGSLKDFGIDYRQVDLVDGKPDYDGIEKVLEEGIKLVLIQRSRGYDWRDAFSIDTIEEICKFVKERSADTIVMVDNCYGEFVDLKEPTEVGADIIAGSLIKNPGGGLALTGGYVAGKKKYVDLAAYRLTSPGIGAEVGASLGQSRLMLQGLFISPHIVCESIKGSIFCGRMMEKLGFETSPVKDSKRGDLIQAIKFNKEELLLDFCRGIQAASPVDAHVVPEPWDMPGYEHQVIMAAGAFVQGSSIELSADAPIKEPYVAYMQGGMTYAHVKLGVLLAIQKMIDNKHLTI